MHEMSIAQAIMEITLKKAVMHETRKVTRIRLLIGQMTEVESETLRSCFSILAEGTIAMEAELDIVTMPLIGCCQECHKQFPIEGFRFRCLGCGSDRVKIISGRELRVEYLEVH